MFVLLLLYNVFPSKKRIPAGYCKKIQNGYNEIMWPVHWDDRQKTSDKEFSRDVSGVYTGNG
jgi:hypothetical protein